VLVEQRGGQKGAGREEKVITARSKHMAGEREIVAYDLIAVRGLRY
jgi:hypothetical protein